MIWHLQNIAHPLPGNLDFNPKAISSIKSNNETIKLTFLSQKQHSSSAWSLQLSVGLQIPGRALCVTLIFLLQGPEPLWVGQEGTIRPWPLLLVPWSPLIPLKHTAAPKQSKKIHSREAKKKRHIFAGPCFCHSSSQKCNNSLIETIIDPFWQKSKIDFAKFFKRTHTNTRLTVKF